MNILKKKAIVGLLIVTANLAGTDLAQAGGLDDIINDSGPKIARAVRRVLRPELTGAIDTFEQETGLSIPRVIRDRIVRPAIGERICRGISSALNRIGRRVRNIFQRPTLEERLLDAAEDFLS